MFDETFLDESPRLAQLAKTFREPIRHRRGVEVQHVFEDFDRIPMDDFYRLTKKQLRDDYVKPLVRMLMVKVRRFAKKDVGFRFYKFDLPAESKMRNVLTFETHDFFLALICEPDGDHFRLTVKVAVQRVPGEFRRKKKFVNFRTMIKRRGQYGNPTV